MAQEQGQPWESDNEVTCPNKEKTRQSTHENKNPGPMSPAHLTHVQRCQPWPHGALGTHTSDSRPYVEIAGFSCGQTKGKRCASQKRRDIDPGYPDDKLASQWLSLFCLVNLSTVPQILFLDHQRSSLSQGCCSQDP